MRIAMVGRYVSAMSSELAISEFRKTVRCAELISFGRV